MRQSAPTTPTSYRLRARQFSDRRRWRVTVENGLEKDRFDAMNPLYVCVVSETRQLLASVRLLPTTGLTCSRMYSPK